MAAWHILCCMYMCMWKDAVVVPDTHAAASFVLRRLPCSPHREVVRGEGAGRDERAQLLDGGDGRRASHTQRALLVPAAGEGAAAAGRQQKQLSGDKGHTVGKHSSANGQPLAHQTSVRSWYNTQTHCVCQVLAAFL